MAILATGCSRDLAVVPLDGARPPAGVVYVLPFTQFTVAMTWRLADCAGSQPKIALRADAVAGTADDARHAYVIDPTSLQALTSTGAISARWQEGGNALVSINASAEDRTGAIIGNVVTAVAKLVPLAVGLPPGGPPPGGPPGSRPLRPPPTPSACTRTAQDALAAARTAKARLDVLNDQIDAITNEVARLGAKAATMGSAVDRPTRRALAGRIDRLVALQQQQAATADTLAAALQVLTSVRIEVWPQDSADVTGGPWSVDSGALTRWFGGAQGANPPEVKLQLERVGSFGRAPATLPTGSGTVTGDGIRYRIPAKGRLVACSLPAGSPLPCASANADTVLTRIEGPVAQLGYVGLFRVRNHTFGSTAASLTFSPLMALETAGYEQKAAPAEGATAALAGAAGTIGTALDPSTRLTSEIANLENLKKKRDALAALQPAADDPSATAKDALDADTSILNARIANARARITLAELEAQSPR